jgi:hypothetical protein
MSETESQDAQIVPAVEADRAVPAVHQAPPYSLVPLSTQADVQALARFTEGLPTLKLTDDERHIDAEPLEVIESDAAEERKTLLREALPQYDAHLRSRRARIKAGELLPNEPVPQYGEVYVGWMGATKQQLDSIDQQLLDLEQRTEERLNVVEQRFQRVMQERLREKATAIVPSDLATVREAFYQYEKTENPSEPTLGALREQYDSLLEARCHDLIQGMRFPLFCRFDGVPYEIDVYTGTWHDREYISLFHTSACEAAFNEAILREHPEWRKIQKEYAETARKHYEKALEQARIDHKPEREVQRLDDSDWLYDCIQDIGGQRAYTVVKGTAWGLQCWSCGKYFKTPTTMPENFPAKKWRVCSWNCLVFRAYPQRVAFASFADFIDPDLSAGSEWWDTIEPTTFPPTSWAQVERRMKPTKQQQRQTPVHGIDMAALPAATTPVLSSPAKSTMAERILGVLREQQSKPITDSQLRALVAPTSKESAEYARERDRLTDEGQIGRSGTGRKMNPFLFWIQ